MRLFVCEFITCGGMRDKLLPDLLRFDAEIMLQALMADLRKLPGIDIISTRDDRLDDLPESVADITEQDDVWDIWGKCMQDADAIWAIAPESQGLLLKMHDLAIESACDFIGCSAEAINITASKFTTARHLLKNDITCIETFHAGGSIPHSSTGWVVKPDDGAGIDACYFFKDKMQLQNWQQQRSTQQLFVIQRYVPGLAASLSVLYHNEQVQLLACNEQLVRFHDGIGRNHGVIVNGLRHKYQSFENIAKEIGQAIPGLSGYVGIDLLVTASGPVVVEINPRLTTSYAGLSESLDTNVAELVLQTINTNKLSALSDRLPTVVTVDMHAGQ